MCLLVPLELLDFLPALDPRRRSFFDLFAFSSATSWRISDPVVTTISHSPDGEEGDLLSCGVAGGVHSSSASSKTHGNSSSSEMMKEVDRASSLFELEEREERRGQEGNAHEGDCGRDEEDDGISMGEVE